MTPFHIEYYWTESTDVGIFLCRNHFLWQNSNRLNKTVQILSSPNTSVWRKIWTKEIQFSIADMKTHDKYAKSERYWSHGSSSSSEIEFDLELVAFGCTWFFVDENGMWVILAEYIEVKMTSPHKTGPLWIHQQRLYNMHTSYKVRRFIVERSPVGPPFANSTFPGAKQKTY